MKTKLELDIEKPSRLKQILEPSLETDERVKYSLKEKNERLNIKAETDGLGPLRGCTDTIFRLAMLAEKIRSR